MRHHERHERYLPMRILHKVLKPFRPGLVKLGKINKQSSNPSRLSAPKKPLKRCAMEERSVEGIWTYDLTPKTLVRDNTDAANGGSSTVRRVIYFAGGGWQMPPSANHWSFCTEIACRLHNTRLTLVSCPLAPESAVSVAFPRIEATVRALLKESAQAGEAVIVAGDSSGGNLALAVTTWILADGLDPAVKPPVAILAISPSVDLRHELLEEIKQVAVRDPIMTLDAIHHTARTWCPLQKLADHHGGGRKKDGGDGGDGDNKAGGQHLDDWSFNDPRVSPALADLSGLVRHGVKIYGVTGSFDVLAPEAELFRRKCVDAGVDGAWLSWEGQMHCFPLAFRYHLRESKEALEWIIDTLNAS